GFHPLAIEDCRTQNQRPKLEEYPGYLFLVLHAPRAGTTADEIILDELHIFLSHRYLVTVHDGPLAATQETWERCQQNSHLNKGISHLFYVVCDRLVDNFFPLLDTIDEEIDRLEDVIVSSPSRQVLDNIFGMKQNLVHLRKIAAPEREVFNSLLYRRDPYLQAETFIYLRDVHDHLVRVYETIDSYRDLMSNALDAYLSTVSNNLNEVMKRLTVIATIFMPLSFLVGFWGQNFQQLPFDRPQFFVLSLVAIATVPAIMLLWFRLRGWT
ncbi:MAG: magnesium/cobalt transporter CorA, partial [Chloroflexi bacterium]|nr:magnesium/cobalt transporter CorA [Chloroflexota bacterium]